MKVRTNVSPVYTATDIESKAEPLLAYVSDLQTIVDCCDYQSPEASVCLPSDAELLQQVTTLAAEKVSDSLRYIFLVGIGGSNLGTKAIYDALLLHRDDVTSQPPQIIFLDAINTSYLSHVCSVIVPQLTSSVEYLVVTISKSGGTTETLVNTEVLLAALAEQVGGVVERTVVITDAGSAYATAATSAGISVLTMPPNVGGRYSIFSAVGLFPLMAAGVDVLAFRSGAFDMRTKCLVPEFVQNPALQSAALSALAYADGYHIHDTFVFSSELESLGKWYRQLLGESIGKEHDTNGQSVHIGITPTVSVGSTDLHSVGQLYLGGPKNKLTTFVSTTPNTTLSIPTARIFSTIVPMIAGKDTVRISQAILDGVKVAYQKQSLPFMEIVLDNITPYELGAFMQYKLMEMMYLGKLLNVNPFDQPHVELYKTETKRVLE